jgi:hypothetical protein
MQYRYHFFGRSQDARRRTKPNAAQQSVDRYQFLRITELCWRARPETARSPDEIEKASRRTIFFAEQVSAT